MKTDFMNIKDLRKKQVVVELKGETKHYSSLREFTRESGLNYQTVLNWVNGYNKPSIDIKIYYVEND